MQAPVGHGGRDVGKVRHCRPSTISMFGMHNNVPAKCIDKRRVLCSSNTTLTHTLLSTKELSLSVP
jgi:hypothetical protein